MTDTHKCPECGVELALDAPAGLCPQCLMKKGFETDSGIGNVPESAKQGPNPGTPPGGFVPPTPGELTPQFPQLEILELLGRGGMGAVYKARQPQLDRMVALKILPAQIGEDPQFAERFTREARALAKLNHPNIVAVYDFGKTEAGLFYFVMEFVDGPNLRRVIQGHDLSPQQALAIVPQVCDALQFAHEEGIVHRDIKPENILLDKKGRVKIADFGLAKLLGVESSGFTLTGTQQVMGTPHYMAPEQFDNPLAVDHRADIYSLGVVLYEMLTGELPIGKFAPPSKTLHVDVRLDEVVLKSLENKPELRYQHASDVKTEVETISKSGSGSSSARKGALQISSLPPSGEIPKQEMGSGAKILTVILTTVTATLIGILISYLALDASEVKKGPGEVLAIYFMGSGSGFALGLLTSLAMLLFINRGKHRNRERWHRSGSEPRPVAIGSVSVSGESSPITVPSTPGIRSAIHRKWLTWYSTQSPARMRAIKAVLKVASFVFAWLWLFPSIVMYGDGRGTYQLGFPTPWLDIRLPAAGATNPDTGGLSLWSLSWLFMLSYSLAYDGYLAIKKAETDPNSSSEARNFRILLNISMFFFVFVFVSSLALGIVNMVTSPPQPKAEAHTQGKAQNAPAPISPALPGGEADQTSILPEPEIVAPPASFQPKLVLKGVEYGKLQGPEFTQYNLSVENHAEFPHAMFRAAPELPPCGGNKNSSRTWLDIQSEEGTSLYGFCDLTSSNDLGNLWFTVLKSQQAPKAVRVILHDRENNHYYKSNLLSLPSVPHPVRVFTPSEPTLSPDLVVPEEDGWCVKFDESRTLQLFEIAERGVTDRVFTYRMKIRSVDVNGAVNLQLDARIPGRGDFSFRNILNPISGTTDWTEAEVKSDLEEGFLPDLLNLNLAVEGSGSVWIKDLVLLQSEIPPTTGTIQPRLHFKGAEYGTDELGEYTLYRLSIENYGDFPNELFRIAPDLPPCGQHENSSRTWVEIHSTTGIQLGGFCTLMGPSELGDLWFRVWKDEEAPEGVYAILHDREKNVRYKSETLAFPPLPRLVKSFSRSDLALANNLGGLDGEAWYFRFDDSELREIPLVEMEKPELEDCILVYRAKIKSEDLAGMAYLSMGFRTLGEESSGAADSRFPISGTTEWKDYEFRYSLGPDEKPDIIKLSLTFQGPGKIWIKDVQLLQEPF